MSDAGQKIIAGLKDAIAGNFARVRIDGQTWARVDGPALTGLRASIIEECAKVADGAADLQTDDSAFEAFARDIASEIRALAPAADEKEADSKS